MHARIMHVILQCEDGRLLNGWSCTAQARTRSTPTESWQIDSKLRARPRQVGGNAAASDIGRRSSTYPCIRRALWNLAGNCHDLSLESLVDHGLVLARYVPSREVQLRVEPLEIFKSWVTRRITATGNDWRLREEKNRNLQRCWYPSSPASSSSSASSLMSKKAVATTKHFVLSSM